MTGVRILPARPSRKFPEQFHPGASLDPAFWGVWCPICCSGRTLPPKRSKLFMLVNKRSNANHRAGFQSKVNSTSLQTIAVQAICQTQPSKVRDIQNGGTTSWKRPSIRLREWSNNVITVTYTLRTHPSESFTCTICLNAHLLNCYGTITSCFLHNICIFALNLSIFYLVNDAFSEPQSSLGLFKQKLTCSWPLYVGYLIM